jgi:hypothetical protein
MRFEKLKEAFLAKHPGGEIIQVQCMGKLDVLLRFATGGKQYDMAGYSHTYIYNRFCK